MRMWISIPLAVIACVSVAWFGGVAGVAPMSTASDNQALAAAFQQPQEKAKKGKQKQKQKNKQVSAAQRLQAVENWPAEGATTVRLWFGHTDQQPTAWDGRVELRGATLLRMRAWRFGEGMTVDQQTASWKCGSWLGPEPATRNFDVHLPPQPRPMVRPAVLIDFEDQGTAQLAVTTAHGNLTIDVAALRSTGQATFLNGAASADLAVFGHPLAVRPAGENAPREWHDFPSIAVSPKNPAETVVCYQTYSQDAGGDRIFIRRRVQNVWQSPEEVSAGVGDYYRTAIVHDGASRLWVVYAAQVQGNWDLYGRSFAGGAWSETVRLTEAPQPDMHHVLVRDREGAAWLVWQGFRDGQSDVRARRLTVNQWWPEFKVSDSAANDWEPAVVALPERGIAVAWDTYDQGNYDVRCRVLGAASPSDAGPVVRVTSSSDLEARPTIAADRQGRLWVAYDTSGPLWGKDTGFWLEIARQPEGTRLYAGRGVGVSIVDPRTGQVMVADQAAVTFPSLNPTLHEHLEYPQLVADNEGRMWMFLRRRAALSMGRRGVGRSFQWEVLASRFDPTSRRWTEPRLVADSDARLDAHSGLAGARDRICAAWICDHRALALNRVDLNSVFVGELSLAGTAPADAGQAQLSAAPAPAELVKDTAHPNEAADVARLRGYRIDAGGKQYSIRRGDMHRHTETSPDGGGDGSMLDAYRYSLDAAAMDYLLVTDHNDGGREYDWWLREKFNDLFRVGEAFVGLYGYERSVSYPQGHRNVFLLERGTRPLAISPAEGPRGTINSGQVLYPYLRERGGICFSHTSATGMGTDWRDNDPELEPLVEIFQGDRTNYEKLGAPWSADANDPGTQEGGFQPLGYVNLALAKGYKLGFQASSDHLSTHLSYSCILTESNTRQGLFDAMKRRHAYAATDNILLDFRAEGTDGEHIMGDVLTTAGPPKLTVRVVGASPLQEVVLIKDDRVIHSVQPQSAEAAFTFTDMEATPGKESYYYVRAIQTNRRLAWASPMWITRQAGR